MQYENLIVITFVTVSFMYHLYNFNSFLNSKTSSIRKKPFIHRFGTIFNLNDTLMLGTIFNFNNTLMLF